MCQPYYHKDGILIFHADARELLPEFGNFGTIITDPVWPNARTSLIGADRPCELWTEIASKLRGDRLIVQLGCDSDPRFLSGVPLTWPFFRVCWLEYACPTRKGRLLYTGDVAYVFGKPPKSAPGRRVMAGRYISTRPDARRVHVTKYKEFGKPRDGEHPCPRRFQHVNWLVAKYGEGCVLDPMCGSGTTLLAAKVNGLEAVGIEIEERFCEIAAERLSQMVFDFDPEEPDYATYHEP